MRGVAALLTMKTIVADLILRSIAKRCVSRDKATALEVAYSARGAHAYNFRLFLR
jgi:hypothetical protein